MSRKVTSVTRHRARLEAVARDPGLGYSFTLLARPQGNPDRESWWEYASDAERDIPRLVEMAQGRLNAMSTALNREVTMDLNVYIDKRVIVTTTDEHVSSKLDREKVLNGKLHWSAGRPG